MTAVAVGHRDVFPGNKFTIVKNLHVYQITLNNNTHIGQPYSKGAVTFAFYCSCSSLHLWRNFN